MTELDPMVHIMCDRCQDEEEFEMTALAMGGWDNRNLTKKLKRAKWTVRGGRHICPDCAEDDEAAFGPVIHD